MNFRKLMTAEQRERLAARDEMYAKQRQQIYELSDENLIATTKYYMTQMKDPLWNPGDPVYDAVLWYIIIPELLERLGDAQ